MKIINGLFQKCSILQTKEYDNEISHKCYMGAGFVDVDEHIVKVAF